MSYRSLIDRVATEANGRWVGDMNASEIDGSSLYVHPGYTYGVSFFHGDLSRGSIAEYVDSFLGIITFEYEFNCHWNEILMLYSACKDYVNLEEFREKQTPILLGLAMPTDPPSKISYGNSRTFLKDFSFPFFITVDKKGTPSSLAGHFRTDQKDLRKQQEIMMHFDFSVGGSYVDQCVVNAVNDVREGKKKGGIARRYSIVAAEIFSSPITSEIREEISRLRTYSGMDLLYEVARSTVLEKYFGVTDNLWQKVQGKLSPMD